MLAGKRPFSGTEEEVLRMHRHALPPSLPSSVPISLRDFVGKLLEKDPLHRYSSAKKAFHALELVSNEAATAKQPSSHARVALRHPHGKVLEELRLLLNGGSNNQRCIPATPGQYFDRVLSELQTSTARQLITIPVDETSTPESLLAAMAHVLMDRGMWTHAPAKLTREVFWNRFQGTNVAFLVKDVDLALSAQPETVGRTIITDLCRLGIPVIFTSMVPVTNWYLAIHGASAPELHDIEIDAIGSDWERFIAGYELDNEKIRDYEARSGRSPELFDSLVCGHAIDIEQRRQSHAKAVRMRLAGLHVDLAKLAAGDLAGVSEAERTVLRWVSVLNATGDALLDPRMAPHWNELGATTT